MADRARMNSTIAPAFAQLAAAALVGLVALPILFGAEAPRADAATGEIRPLEALWLGTALTIALWLLAITPTLFRSLTGLLASLEMSSTPMTPRFALASVVATMARWLVATGYVLMAQAMLRRPFVAVLGTMLGPSLAEALFAATALALLLLALYSLHRAARPLLEAAAWHVLDAVVATSGSEATGNVPLAQDMATARAPGGDGAATHAAPTLARGVVEATVAAVTLAAGGGDATLPDADSKATVRAVDDESTLPDANRQAILPAVDGDATLPQARLGDETLPAQGSGPAA